MENTKENVLIFISFDRVFSIQQPKITCPELTLKYDAVVTLLHNRCIPLLQVLVHLNVTD